MINYPKSPFILLFSFLFSFTNLFGQQMEMCEYLRPKLTYTVLPVFPKDPLSIGIKSPPVFDVMLDEAGKPKYASSLYVPENEFTSAFVTSLAFRNYSAATECEVPVPCVYRDIVYSYFYVKNSDSEKTITKLPYSVWRLDREVYDLATKLTEPFNINLKINEKGNLLEAKADKIYGNAFVKAIFDPRIGMKLFTPAYIGENSIPCELVMVFGNKNKLTKEVKELIDQKSKDLISPKVSDAKEIAFKINYSGSGYMSSIIAKPSEDMTLKDLWVAMAGMRFWHVDMVKRGYKEEFIILGIVPGENSVVMSRREMLFALPEVKKAFSPYYPASLNKFQITGKVVIECVIDEKGKVNNPHVYKSDHDLFSYEALKAIEKWKFKPGVYDGKAVKVKVRIPINFNLR